MLLLAAMEQAVHNDRVRLSHVILDKLLDGLRIEHQEGTFSCLVVHTLACLEKTSQELGPKLVELLVHLGAHQVKNFFDLLNENDLLGGASDWPELEQT